MDGLHNVLHAIRRESGAQPRDHVEVFREFLDRLDRAARRRPAQMRKSVKLKERRRPKR